MDRLAAEAAEHVIHWPSGLAEDADHRPRMLVEGRGCLLVDADGNEYLDGTAILGATQIGHGREEMAEAIADQVRSLEYASLSNGYSHAPALELGKKLAEIAPGELSTAFFSTGGAEAIETGIKIARHFHRQHGRPERTKVIGRKGSYHGLTYGALTASGLTVWQDPFGPLLPGFTHVDAPYVYRAEEMGSTAETCGRDAAQALEQCILAEGPETVAAFIAEPVPNPLAVRVPPDDYWPAVRQVCDRYGVLLIIDEILNGFGRTGKMFASEHWGLEADIMAVGKGITSGYIPLSATLVTPPIADAIRGRLGEQLLHGSTYSGHPVACAAALANLEIMEREDLVANAASMGERLMDGLRSLGDRPFVGNVSGIGLLTSVELVSDKETKELAPAEVGLEIVASMAAECVLIRSMPNSIYFYPPLSIASDEVDRMVGSAANALDLLK